MIRTVIFDLDFTLYDMRQVLDVAMSNVINKLRLNTGLNGKRINDSFEVNINRYGILNDYLFNIILTDLNLDQDKYLKLCIESYHEKFPSKLDLYPGAKPLLDYLSKSQYRLLLLTDGNYKTQQKKVRALKIKHYFDQIIYTSCLNSSKPEAFFELKNMLNLEPRECIMIGDHPEKDILGAKRIGIQTVRIKKGEFESLSNVAGFVPDMEIFSLEELRGVL